jgi:hypothetical protein
MQTAYLERLKSAYDELKLGRRFRAPSRIHVVHADVRHVRRGRVIWEEQALENILHDDGEIALLSAYFDTDLAGYGAPPLSLYIGLDNRSTLAENQTLASLTGEPTGNGYARKAVSTTTGWTISAPTDDYQAKTGTLTFDATGAGWGPVSKLFLATTADNLGKLLVSVALSTSRTLVGGDQLQVDLAIKMSE